MHEEHKKHMLKELRNTFFTGLVTIIPIFITFSVISFLLGMLENAVPLIGGRIYGLGIITTIIVILIIGALARNIFTKQLLTYFDELLEKLPVVKNVYSSVKQIVNAVTLSSQSTSFKQVALVEYPRKGMQTIGFITRDKSSGIKANGKDLGKDLVSVFLPTSPNPTSGYFVMLPSADVTILDMTVEEGFKMIMSAGIVTPDN